MGGHGPGARDFREDVVVGMEGPHSVPLGAAQAHEEFQLGLGVIVGAVIGAELWDILDPPRTRAPCAQVMATES